jgi:radical SAM protein with 4Fe4S-binding SPASM domain
MTTAEIKFYPKRQLTQAQQQRIADHQASVQMGSDGTFNSSVRTIITPKGDLKEVTYKTIRPGFNERIMKPDDVLDMFSDLAHMNLIVTNACNLSCSYCYEQHNKDYGRFTAESLKQLYDFLVRCNDNTGKLFQFFGGEPMIHKALILDFIRKYKDELARNANTVAVSMITNGILLTPEFIDEYFSSPHVCMSISLDTDIAEIDHREIGQERIDHIIQMIGRIPKHHKDSHMVSVRCTIAMENAPRLVEFAQRLYDKGLRAMVIHPLTMSSVNGHMVWNDEDWNNLHRSVLHIIQTFPNFEVQFSEGVGAKVGNNCMIGSDMIAVDASGDYSGCHFFTNQKEAASHTILGNLLLNQVYVDRYYKFQETYDQMFITEPQCQACDLKGFCYQCPAGNSDSGRGQLFRPDDMCQKIVRLFLDLQNDIVRKTFNAKLQELVRTVQEKGEQYTFAKSITHLMYKKITGNHLEIGEVDDFADRLPPYENILGRFWSLLDQGTTDIPCACDYIPAVNDEPLDIKTFYERLMVKQGKPVSASQKQGTINDVNKRTFYLALLHMVLLNDKGDDFTKPRKIVKL